MEQRKRPGGDGGLGYYTSWENLKVMVVSIVENLLRQESMFHQKHSW